MSAARIVARGRLRRRAGALVALALVTAIAGSIALAALAGARRTSTSLSRALDAAAVADVSVDVAVADPGRLGRVDALPEVRRHSAYLFTAVRPAGTDLVGGIDVIGITPIDRRATRTMDRPRLSAGRLPDPDRAGEVVLTPDLARKLHATVGSRRTFEAYRQGQVQDIFSQGDVRPAGVRLPVTVVGIGLPLEGIGATGEDGIGAVFFSPAVWRRYGVHPAPDFRNPVTSDLGAFRQVLRVELVHGSADGPRFLGDAFRIFGDAADTTFSEARPEVFSAAGDTVRVQAVALLLFAVVAGVATAMAVGQAAAREASLAVAADETALHAVGMTRVEVVASGVLPVVAALVAGIALAVAGAIAASPLLPFGLAHRLEPSPGIMAMPVVVVAGAALLLAVLALRTAASAWRTSSLVRSEAATAWDPTGGRVPAAALGVGMALHPGDGRRAVPSRSTLVSAVIALAGVVAALTFSTSLSHLASTPRLYGENWDLEVLLQSNGGAIADRETPRLVADPRIGDLARYDYFELAFGERRVAGVGVDVLKGEAGPTIRRGRPPHATDEIAVDPAAVARPRPSIGDRVKVSGGDGPPLAMRVVGLLTSTGPGGFVVTRKAADRLHAERSDSGFFVTWVPGTDVAAARRQLHARFVELDDPAPTARVHNVTDVRRFPFALAAFLAVLGLAAVSHLLVLGVRRRRHDLAVAKVLGFTRRQVRAVLTWQATAVGVVALVAGVPLGVAAGRWSWSVVARRIGVVDAPVVPAGGVVLAAVAAVIAVNAVAVVLARGAARMHPAEVLRAD